ncbi:hypothetical protein BS78_04G045300 [Paspalum vaginatum]|nr:hypothetical protein BS78_04G045300 [Paspalum vaginatum]
MEFTDHPPLAIAVAGADHPPLAAQGLAASAQGQGTRGLGAQGPSAAAPAMASQWGAAGRRVSLPWRNNEPPARAQGADEKADSEGIQIRVEFIKNPFQSEDNLVEMFDDIVNDGADHWNPMSSIPIIPPTQFANAKKRSRIALDRPKKAKSTALVMQEQITRIADSAVLMASRKQSEVTIRQVMDLVVACGAACGTDEHYIATKLFVNKGQREMFMTLPSKESRFNWLQRNYNDYYGE